MPKNSHLSPRIFRGSRLGRPRNVKPVTPDCTSKRLQWCIADKAGGLALQPGGIKASTKCCREASSGWRLLCLLLSLASDSASRHCIHFNNRWRGGFPGAHSKTDCQTYELSPDCRLCQCFQRTLETKFLEKGISLKIIARQNNNPSYLNPHFEELP